MEDRHPYLLLSVWERRDEKEEGGKGERGGRRRREEKKEGEEGEREGRRRKRREKEEGGRRKRRRKRERRETLYLTQYDLQVLPSL